MPHRSTTRWIDTAAQVLVAATAVVAACIALTGTGPRRHDPAPGLRAAMAAYDAGQWPQAYARLSAAADAGDPSAARIVTMMARQGPLLFGQHFDVSPERLQRWERAARAGVGAAAPARVAALGGAPVSAGGAPAFTSP